MNDAYVVSSVVTFFVNHTFHKKQVLVSVRISRIQKQTRGYTLWLQS